MRGYPVRHCYPSTFSSTSGQDPAISKGKRRFNVMDYPASCITSGVGRRAKRASPYSGIPCETCLSVPQLHDFRCFSRAGTEVYSQGRVKRNSQVHPSFSNVSIILPLTTSLLSTWRGHPAVQPVWYTIHSFCPLTALGSCGGCAVYWVGSPPQPALLLQPYILPSSVSASPLCGHLSGTLGWLSQGGPIYGSKAVAPERHLPGKV